MLQQTSQVQAQSSSDADFWLSQTLLEGPQKLMEARSASQQRTCSASTTLDTTPAATQPA